ncbi:hypothetical protein M422DRAFT_199885 [Sphaerobolus stellatus SS14]|nr:hypothetical protein M422DRAFT_199885 [Sphaerobolus stellatus SS14]
MDLSKYTLVEATREQLVVSRKRQAVTWARGMTEAEFMSREEYLEKMEHSSNGRFICWALVPRDNTFTLNFPCSCETFRRKTLVIRPSGALEEVVGYGIASVYCDPEQRGKGFASHMMRLLHHVLAPAESLPPFPSSWGAPPERHPGVGDALLSVLYSDVGHRFYELCGPAPDIPGWIVHKPISTVWHLDYMTGVSQQPGDKIEWLNKEACEALWEEDAEYIKEQLSQPSNDDLIRFTFLPNDGIAGYLLERVLAEAPLTPQQPLEYWGVKVTHKDGSQAYATWTLDLELAKPPNLVITRLKSTPDMFPSLMKALLTEATRLSSKAIEVWNLEQALIDIAANMGGKTTSRTEHLPAVAWYVRENLEKLEWIFNEKFPWC